MRTLLKSFGVLLVGWLTLAVLTVGPAATSHMEEGDSSAPPRKRPFYEYPGNYRDKVNQAKERFRQNFGYELMDLDQGWTPREIEWIQQAFSQLPEDFYRLPGLKGFYRASMLMGQDESLDTTGVPAATFPKFMTVFRKQADAYLVNLNDDRFRIEFYNSLFYEDREDFINIVHHEMAHAYDLAHGFLSFSDAWIKTSRFRVLNLAPLDARPDSDFLYALVSSPEIDNYAPVASRNIPTYSRESIQEDFANSVTAYIHYPYFRYTHPTRYRYLKATVFHDREYFHKDPRGSDYAKLILEDFDEAFKNMNWEQMRALAAENSRIWRPDLDAAMVSRLSQVVEAPPSREQDYNLAVTSCYFYDPKATELIQRLIVARRVTFGEIIKNPRCARTSRQVFEADVSHWPPSQVYFFREQGRDYVQFLDPAVLIAQARGLQTSYVWRLYRAGDTKKPVLQGRAGPFQTLNGAFKLSLADTAQGAYRPLEGVPLILEVGAERTGAQPGKSFMSEFAQIKFVIHPWFQYIGPAAPGIQVHYPPGFLASPDSVK